LVICRIFIEITILGIFDQSLSLSSIDVIELIILKVFIN
jgi:hypothetical protein